MRFVFSVISVLLTNASIAQDIPERVGNAHPSAYLCHDTGYVRGIETKREFNVVKKGNYFAVDFLESLRPGNLADYLEPMGIDERIIAHYYGWKLSQIRIPVDSCQTNSFGSLSPEKITCKANQVTLKFSANYRNLNGAIKTDQYELKNAIVSLNIKVRSGLDGTTCFKPHNGIKKAVELSFGITFNDRDGKPVTVTSKAAFHPECFMDFDTDDVGPIYFGGCHLNARDAFSIGVADLINIREKK